MSNVSNTPKNFALQLGSLISLYVSLVSLNVLLFSVITIAFPDDVDAYWRYESASSAIRFSIATLIVFFPAYLALTRIVNQIRRQPDGLYLTLTKWLIYLSLLAGGGVLLGDFVAIIYNWLEGEITIRFILKALVLAVSMLLPIFYYLKDAQGYWQTNEKQSLLYGLLATALVAGALMVGFLHTETPEEVREMRIDDNQISDLQSIQFQIEDYYRVYEELPADMSLIYSNIPQPDAPENRSEYQYNAINPTHYQLCAEFAYDSKLSEYDRVMPVTEKNHNWTHGSGIWCFERSVAGQKN